MAFALLIGLLSTSVSFASPGNSKGNNNRNNAPGIQRKLNSSENNDIEKKLIQNEDSKNDTQSYDINSKNQAKSTEKAEIIPTKREIQQSRLAQRKLLIEEFKENKSSLKERKLEERIFINGFNMKFETPPVIREGRTLIPVRAITEGFGAQVLWNSETSTVTILKDNNEIILTLGSNIVLVNGEEKEIEVSAQSINNRTFVPLRFISDFLGINVEYDPETGDIDIIDLEEDEEDNDETIEETGINDSSEPIDDYNDMDDDYILE